MWWLNYVGLPFADRGRDALNGFDCWGLVRQVYSTRLGIELPSYDDDYADTLKAAEICAAIEKHSQGWTTVTGDVQEYDLIILRMRGVPMHVGIVTREGYMLHSLDGMGVVHHKYNSMAWSDRIVGFIRHSSLCKPPAIQQ